MSKSDQWESDLLKLLFQNIAVTKVGDAAGLQPSAAPGNMYISLHTADPGETGLQTTSETAYTGYARIGVVRSAAGWTVSGTAPTQVAPVANIDFGQCTALPGAAITYFGAGTDVSGGTGKLLYSGTVTPNITMAVGVIPRLTTASTITED